MSTWHMSAIGLGLVVGTGCTYNTQLPPAPHDPRPAATAATAATAAAPAPTDTGAASYRAGAVRYQVRDVSRAADFYTTHLGFTLADRAGPAFAMVRNGPLTLYLSGPKSSGARPMPDGTAQVPGGWNRIVLEVHDLPARAESLRQAGVRFRNGIETGPGGRQVQVEDPDGNPIELFEPAAPGPVNVNVAGDGPERMQ